MKSFGTCLLVVLGCRDEVKKKKKKKKLERTHGHGQQCGDFGGVEGLGEEEAIEGIYGDGKKKKREIR